MIEPVRKYVLWTSLYDSQSVQVYHGLNTSDVIVNCYFQGEAVLRYSCRIDHMNAVTVRVHPGYSIDKIVVIG